MFSRQCLECINYTVNGKCEAFPNGIPEEIINGWHDHKKPYKGDNGIRYENVKKVMEKLKKVLDA
tara:strand:+ start:515 stop:709 length:195 start_codon:yes stop_codon:yes gene_type:complete